MSSSVNETDQHNLEALELLELTFYRKISPLCAYQHASTDKPSCSLDLILYNLKNLLTACVKAYRFCPYSAIKAKNSVSFITDTPNFSAFSSLEPAFSPATKHLVLLEILPLTRAPKACSICVA